MEGGESMSPQAAPEPRLMITKMVLENFKSYYGVQEIGPFHHCFSSVVGPNGSGKSNVIDALLFVFGKRAKQIRQGKLSDLIHKSELHQNLERCRVSIHFQDIIDLPDGGYEAVPNSEMVVMREALASSANASNYYVDGKKKTWTEVADILQGRKIDLTHNRFLILQGEVEQIAMMKPKAEKDGDEGILEYLEDIIGSDRFKEDIQKTGLRVEELNEKRAEKLVRVKAVDAERKGLEDGKKEAESFLSMENELTVKQSQLYQIHLHDALKNVAALKECADEAKAKLEDARRVLADEGSKGKVMEKEHKKKLALYNEVKQAVEDAKKEYTAYERKDIQFKEDLKHMKAKHKKLEKSVQADKASLSEMENTAVKHESDIVKLETENAALMQKLAKEESVLQEILESLKGETSQFQERLAVKQKELLPFSQAQHEAQSSVDVCRASLELLTTAMGSVQKQLAESKENLAQAKNTILTREADVKSLAIKKTQTENKIKEAEGELSSLADKEGKMDVKVKEARMKVEEQKVVSLQAHSKSKVLEVLQAQCRAGKVTNVYGRLGDLGTIDDKYDVAVTTACGALDHIVVQTTEEAKWCVEYLRKHGVGRATFIVLDKIEYLDKAVSTSFPSLEDSVRLFDLVKPKKAIFRTAFYFGLRDTLVAKDLEQASRIAYQGGKAKHRVVTLQGQLIDTSGTMSGGGTKVARGGMSSRETEAMTPEMLAKMEKELAIDITQLNDARDRQRSLKDLIASLQKEIDGISTLMQKYTMEIESAKKQVKDLNAQIEELDARNSVSDEDSAKEAQLRAQLAKDEKVLAKAKEKASAIEAEVKAIEDEIMNVGGTRLKAQKATVDNINEALTLNTSRKTKAGVEIKSSKRNIPKLQSKIAKDSEELAAVEKEMEESKNGFQDIESGAAKVLENVRQATALLEEREEEMKAIKEEHETLKAAMATLQKKEVDLEQSFEESNRSLKEYQGKEKQLEKKLKSLKLHDIEQYGGKKASQNDVGETPSSHDEGEESDGADKHSSSSENNYLRADLQLPVLTEEQKETINVETLLYEITVLEERIKQSKPNLTLIKEYYKKEEEYLGRFAELEAITAERDTVKAEHDDLRKQRLSTFMTGFTAITLKLKEMYQMITLGGDAELELVDRLNPFSEGIEFSVRPPKKSWKNISNLSGGEKTLSSLALVFALHHYKPTPLYVMDEIDAALDFRNVSIVANYIKERTKNAQFIIISLRNNMFELADRLVGIYKTEDCTKSVTINPSLLAGPLMTSSSSKPREEEIESENINPNRVPLSAI